LLYDLLVEYVDRKVEVPVAEDPTIPIPSQTSTSNFLFPKKCLLKKKIAKRGLPRIRKPKKGRST